MKIISKFCSVDSEIGKNFLGKCPLLEIISIKFIEAKQIYTYTIIVNNYFRQK